MKQSNPLHDARKDARWKIIQLANQHKMRDRVAIVTRVKNPDGPGTIRTFHFREPKLFGMKDLQQAVFMLRQRKLGNVTLFRTAGFNA